MSTNRAKRKRKRYVSPRWRIARRVIVGSLIAYASLLLVLIGMETRLVYPGAFMEERAASQTASMMPGPSFGVNSATTQESDTGVKAVKYESRDRHPLVGRLIERGHDKAIVLFFHGNGTKAAWLEPRIAELSSRLDANVMAAEYRGFEDDTTPTEQGVLNDCFAARDYLCDRFQVKPTDLILYGESLGGGCAVAVASRDGAKALVLERTFDRMIDVAASKYPVVPVKWLMRNRYDSIAKMTVYHGPLIMVHGTADELIPIQHGRHLFDSARCQPKHWIEVDGCGHNDPLPETAMSELIGTLRQFTANP